MVMTVRGPVSAQAIGITLPHEHILIDQSPSVIADHHTAGSYESTLSPELIPLVKRDPRAVRDNLIMQDVTLATRELGYFFEQGGGTVIDMTNIGMGRNPEGLKEISHVTGLHIITSTGFYVEDMHPEFVREAGIEKLADLMIEELTEGINSTTIKAGMIGEIGTSTILTDQEEKVLRAAARAQRETDAPMNIHLATMKGREGPKVLNILEKEGVNLNRVVLSHMDFVCDDFSHLSKLARRGVFLEFDSFGANFIVENQNFIPPNDEEKVKALKHLIDDGFKEQLLISQDVCFKIQLKAFGGPGYDHIVRHVLPFMDKEGIDNETIRTIMINNPQRLLQMPV